MSQPGANCWSQVWLKGLALPPAGRGTATLSLFPHLYSGVEALTGVRGCVWGTVSACMFFSWLPSARALPCSESSCHWASCGVFPALSWLKSSASTLFSLLIPVHLMAGLSWPVVPIWLLAQPGPLPPLDFQVPCDPLDYLQA